MLRIEIYTTLLLLVLFILSMLGSLSHSDINTAFSLFAYYVILSNRQSTALKDMLLLLMVGGAIVLVSDVWVLFLISHQKISGTARVFGYVWVVGEVGVKIGLLVMLGMWRGYKGEELSKYKKRNEELVNS